MRKFVQWGFFEPGLRKRQVFAVDFRMLSKLGTANDEGVE